MANAEPPATDYPRKRVAIACDICRVRRSRCNAAKPACSKCVELEVTCVYRKPSLWDREPVRAAANAALSKVDERLDQIQASIAELAEQVSNISRNNSIPANALSPFGFSPPSNVPNYAPFRHGSTQSVSIRGVSASRPYGHRMPNLITFVAPPSFGPFSYDSTAQFFGRELSQGEEFISCLNGGALQPVQADVTTQTCWRLQRSFVSNFLRWLPIFDDETCLQHIQTAWSSQFRDKTPSVCLTLLVFAIGAMAEDQQLYEPDPKNLPGFQYLILAYEILKDMKSPTREITYLQCRTLFAAYLIFAIRPVQAWTEISQVSRDCMVILKTDWRSGDTNWIAMMERTYWVAYVIENELEICLELPSSGIRSFQETLALPTSPFEEGGLYFLLALISLRKLQAEVIETIGFKFGHAIYVPIVAMELQSQLQNWHSHLPPSLRFPIDSTPLFDLRKSHLRIQFLALSIVIFWPFVFRYIEDGPGGDPDVEARAKECLDCCLVYLGAADGMLMQKSFVSHVNVRTSYAMTMLLLLTYRLVYRTAHTPETQSGIRRSLESLGLWKEVPFLKDPLDRIYGFAKEIGLDIAPAAAW